jgi:hypothetical protein
LGTSVIDDAPGKRKQGTKALKASRPEHSSARHEWRIRRCRQFDTLAQAIDNRNLDGLCRLRLLDELLTQIVQHLSAASAMT